MSNSRCQVCTAELTQCGPIREDTGKRDMDCLVCILTTEIKMLTGDMETIKRLKDKERVILLQKIGMIDSLLYAPGTSDSDICTSIKTFLKIAMEDE